MKKSVTPATVGKSPTEDLKNLYHNLGWITGFLYLLSVRYSPAQHLIEQFLPFEEQGHIITESMFSDPVLGEFFNEAFIKNPDVDAIVESYGNPHIAKLGEIFLLSFVKAVTEMRLKSSSVKCGVEDGASKQSLN
ncbi:MAG: hypothetical protein M1511_18145 [Deltaproteobacteria bacterium]|nr:hypothetical protein [Deltaproteobacteria bacterium]